MDMRGNLLQHRERGAYVQRQLTYRYFLLSFSTAFLVLSVLFLFLMITVHPSPTRAEDLAEQPVSAPYTQDASDALTVLFIGSETGSSQAGSYILARFDPAGGKVPVTALPPQTIVENAGKSEPLSAVFAYGGADYARNALSRTLGIPIDRYVRIDTGAFITCAGVIGAVEFDLPADMALEGRDRSIVLSAGRQLLDGHKVASVIAFRDLEGGEPARCRLAGELTAAIVNQRIDVTKSTLVDKIFERIINLIDTDISYTDYDNRREAALYLADRYPDPAASLSVQGRFNEDGTRFTLSDTFLARLAREFS